MKQLLYTATVLLLCLLVGFGCVQHEDFMPSIADLALRTGVEEIMVDEGVVKVTSQVEEVGDGITVYGHFWSANRGNVTSEIVDFSTVDSTRVIGSLNQGQMYEDLINCSRFNPDETYFIKAYTIDRHGSVCTAPNDVEFIPVECDSFQLCTASFDIASGNLCIASCEVQFSNTSESDIPVTAVWDYGDNTPPDALGRHTYEKPGVYTINLTLLDEDNTVCNSITKVDAVTIQGVTFGPDTYPAFGPGVAAIQLDSRDYLILTSAQNGGSAGQDIALVRVTETGTFDPDFTKFYDAATDDQPAGMVQLSSGEIIITGTGTNPATGDRDIFWINLNEDGVTASGFDTPRFIEKGGSDEVAQAVIENDDHDVVIIGATGDQDDIFLAVLSSSLSFEDVFEDLNLPGQEIGYALVNLPGSEIGLIGVQTLESTSRGFMIRRQDNGNSIPGDSPIFISPNEIDFLFTAELLGNGNLVMGGSSANPATMLGDILIVGGTLANPQNTVLVSDTPDIVEIARAMVRTGGPTFVIGGKRGNSAFMTKYEITESGFVEIWSETKTFPGVNTINALLTTEDCGLLGVGGINANLWLVKVDDN